MAEPPGATNHNTTNTADQLGPDGNWDENQGATSRLMSQEGVFQLTQDLRKFSDTLTSLKAVFFEEKEPLVQGLRVVAHERLGELLKVLKSIVNKYQELNSTGILNAAENLINHIKNFNYESVEETVPPEIFGAINNLALAFSSSVSECLIGDINISPRHSTVVVTAPYENVAPQQRQSQSMYDPTLEIATVNSTTDEAGSTQDSLADTFVQATENLDISFERAKAWSKYANDLLAYMKKKANIEMEYAKQLTKLSQTTRAALSEQSFLPFQSLYYTALDNDKDFASNLTTTYQTLITAHKFVEPLQARRVEHDRQLKIIRDAWRKDKRRLEDAESNLKKAKQQYQTRKQEYQKAKDAAIRADQQQYAAGLVDGSHSRQGSGTGSSQLAHNVAAGATLGIIPTTKAEKKKKQEDDSYMKSMQAEQYYRACVSEANQRRRELEKKEEDYLKKIRDLMTQCDQTTKAVTINFFSLHCSLASPVLVQFQALLEESKDYEPGFQYVEYLRHVSPPQHTEVRQDYQFEACSTEGTAYMEHSTAPQRTSIHEESSPISNRASYTGRLQTRRTSQRGISDTESSSSRSLDDLSPSASPGDPVNRKDMHKRRPSTEGSLSSEEILDEGKENDTSRQPALQTSKDFTSHSPDSSPAPQRSQLPKMMKMVANVKEAFSRGMKRNAKSSIFGVDFATAAQDIPDGIPLLVKKCIAEIDNRALTTKGIFRINGVKNRVEKLCSLLDSPQCLRVDLSEQLPHDVSGVLKYFLRQLPEPLVLHRLYYEFLEVGKEYMEYKELLKQNTPPDPVPGAGQDDNAEADGEVDVTRQPQDPPEQQDIAIKFIPVLDMMRSVVDKLPMANRNTLQYIIAHLSRVAEHSNLNKMIPSNLAIIFGPTLLRPTPSNESSQPLQSLIELPSQSNAIEMLIIHRNEIFDNYTHKVQSEEIRDQFKGQSSVDIADEIQIVEHESDSTLSTSQFPKLLPLHSDPPSVVPIVPVSNNGDAPTNSDEVGLSIDDHSTSGTSSSGELFSVDEINSHFGQKDRVSRDSSTGQSNRGMNVIDDGRTVVPHCPGLTKSSSSRDIAQGEFVSTYIDGRNLIRDDIFINPFSGTASSQSCLVRNASADGISRVSSVLPRPRSSATDKTHSSAKGRATSHQENQQRNRNPSSDDGLKHDPADDIPVVPSRTKSKRRYSDKPKSAPEIPLSRGQSLELPETNPASPHRPRSRQISGYISRPSQDIVGLEEFHVNVPRRVSVPVSPPPGHIHAPVKRHSAISNIINPNAIRSESSSVGRKLPQIPTQTAKTTKAVSPTRSNPMNKAGRTPPFNKAQAWTFVKGDIVNLDGSVPENKGQGIQRKILMEDDEESVSFC